MTRLPEFGLSLVPTWADPIQVLRLARLADEHGYDLVGIQDHPYQWRYLDTWTLIAWLAGQTTRVRYFPDVVGPAQYWVDQLTGLMDVGMDTFVFWPAHDEERQIEAFAAEVIPAVRKSVSA
jgi:Luciferase-like monooxygenase